MIDLSRVRFAPRSKLSAFDLRWRRRHGSTSSLYKGRSWVRRDTFTFLPKNHKTKMMFRLSILALTSPPSIEKKYEPINDWFKSKHPARLKKLLER